MMDEEVKKNQSNASSAVPAVPAAGNDGAGDTEEDVFPEGEESEVEEDPEQDCPEPTGGENVD